MFGDLVVNLTAKINRFTGPMNQARGVLARVREAAANTSSSVFSSMARLSGIGAMITSALGGLTLGGGLTWGVGLAVQAEQAQIAFEVMLGSADKAKAMISDLNNYSAATPYSQGGIRDAAKTLLNFGVSGESILPTIRMLGDIASGDEHRLGHLSLVFGQIAATGRLMGQDLLQLINGGFNPLQAISARTGESVATLKKRMEKGGISFAEVEQAFRDVTSAGGRFYQMAERQSTTVAGLWSTLKDNVGMSLAEIAAALMQGFNLKGFFGSAIQVTTTFREHIAEWIPIFVQIGATTRQWLSWMAGIVDKAIALWPIISPWVTMLMNGVAVLATMWTAWSAIVVTAGLLMNPLTWIIAGIGALAMGVGWVVERFGGLGVVLETIGFGVMNFGLMTKIVAGEMLLWFTSGFNAIAFFFTDTLPTVFAWAFRNGAAMFRNLATYATQVFLDLAARLGDVMAEIWSRLNGDGPIARDGAHWGELGASARLTDVPKLEWPVRQSTDFENSLAEMLTAQREKLAEEWRKVGEKKEQFGLDPSDPKYKSGADAAVEEQKKKDAQFQMDLKPLKLSGALEVGTKDAYSAIVNAMAGTRGASVQDKQLAEQKRQAMEAKRAADELAKLNRNIERNEIAVVNTLDD